jgi:ABC-type branched-subunit amino acid transport system ATPase component
MTMLALADVRSGYGRMEVLHGVSLDLAAGALAAIVGPNGAGKSVLLKTVAGYLRASAGSIRLGESPIAGLTPSAIHSRGITYIPQSAITFPRMTVEENLRLGGYLLRERRKIGRSLERVYEFAPVLKSLRGVAAGSLSGGQQKMLALGRALMSQPRLLLFDEPSIGLDPKSLKLVFEKIVELNRSGVTVLLVEQNVRMALAVANPIYVLELGTLQQAGTPDEINASGVLDRVYFGRSGIAARPH